VKRWLAERPHYHVHFTPTRSSWLNQIERWFAEITRKRIRRGTFRSVRDLIKAIRDYVRQYNKNPQPFQWVATASKIIRKVNKYKGTLDGRLELGLKLETAPSSEESGMYEVCQGMSADKLKVFRNLPTFFHEYPPHRRNDRGQVVKENDERMNCLRHRCVSGRQRMTTEPVATLEPEWYSLRRTAFVHDLLRCDPAA
jgi:DDE superfamily endonuclease